MRPSRLLITFCLVAGFSIIYWRYFYYQARISGPIPGSDPAVSTAPAEAPKPLLGFLEELESLVLARQDLRIEMKKMDDSWRLLAPVRGVVRGSFIKELSQRLHEIILEGPFLVEPEDLSRFGLSAPTCVLELSTTQIPQKRLLQIGDETPDRRSIYVKWQGDPHVYLVQRQVRDILNITVATVRTDKVFSSVPRPLAGFEVRWKDRELKAIVKNNRWRSGDELGRALDPERINDFLEGFWDLWIQRYADQDPFPEIPEENYVKFERMGASPWILWVGPPDETRDAYPVFFPEDDLKVWVARKDLGPLLAVPFDALYSRSFLDFSTRQLDRVKFQMNDREISFVSKEGIWHPEGPALEDKSLEQLEILLAGLPSLKYLKALSADEKSALLFDPGEVGLTLFLFRTGDQNPFIELKFYVRDFVYLEINSSPPLYVLPREVLSPLLHFLQPFLASA